MEVRGEREWERVRVRGEWLCVGGSRAAAGEKIEAELREPDVRCFRRIVKKVRTHFVGKQLNERLSSKQIDRFVF
jgi:hypothetical protein